MWTSKSDSHLSSSPKLEGTPNISGSAREYRPRAYSYSIPDGRCWPLRRNRL